MLEKYYKAHLYLRYFLIDKFALYVCVKKIYSSIKLTLMSNNKVVLYVYKSALYKGAKKKTIYLFLFFIPRSDFGGNIYIQETKS